MRCLALFTGGLDSALAVRLMQAQNIDVVGVYVTSPLCATEREKAEVAAADLGIELQILASDAECCELVRNPRFGRVQSTAPCLDCRIATLGKARELMTAKSADFVVSGEVIGQRPRTASRELETVAHHARLSDLVVRPLSAGLLPPTTPETNGWVDRSRLMAIQGKSRKTQHEVASSLGLPIPPPRPDCPLLAEPLGQRLRDLLHSQSPIDEWRLALLPIGRHVRLDDVTWVVLGRNQVENDKLLDLERHCSAQVCGPRQTSQCVVAMPQGFPGPTALLVGSATEQHCQVLARLVVRFSRTDVMNSACVVIRGPEGERVLQLLHEDIAPVTEEIP